MSSSGHGLSVSVPGSSTGSGGGHGRGEKHRPVSSSGIGGRGEGDAGALRSGRGRDQDQDEDVDKAEPGMQAEPDELDEADPEPLKPHTVDVYVREKVRVESADPSLLSLSAKLGALSNALALARRNLDVVLDGAGEFD